MNILFLFGGCLVGGVVGFLFAKLNHDVKKLDNIYKDDIYKGAYDYPKSDMYKWTYKK